MFGTQIKLDEQPLSYSKITISNINMNYFKYIRLVKQKHTGDPSYTVYIHCFTIILFLFYVQQYIFSIAQ